MLARWIEIGVTFIRKAATKLEREDCSSGSLKFRLSFTFFEYRKLEEREKKGRAKKGVASGLVERKISRLAFFFCADMWREFHSERRRKREIEK